MLIKKGAQIVNLDNVTYMSLYIDTEIKFWFIEKEGETTLEFNSKKERDDAIDYILDAYDNDKKVIYI